MFGRIHFDQLLDFRITVRCSITRLIPIVAGAGFLPITSELANFVRNCAITRIRRQTRRHITFLANSPTDIEPGQVTHRERSPSPNQGHKWPRPPHAANTLPQGETALAPDICATSDYPLNPSQTPTTTPTFADFLGDSLARRQGFETRILCAHDFQQTHHICRTEKM